MNTAEATHFFKVSCPQCSQNIEVPFELYGHPIECPSCEHSFKARHPAEMQRKKIQLTKKFWLAVLGIVLVFVSISVLVWLGIRFSSDLPVIGRFAGSAIVAVCCAIIGALIVIWAILWILFPVFVYYGMKRMEVVLRQIEYNSRSNRVTKSDSKIS